MNILSRFKLRTKLGLLLALSVAAMLGIGATTLRQRMLDDRLDKFRSEVSSTVALAAALEVRVGAQEITRQQAQDLFHEEIRAIRFDHGTGYIAVTDLRTGYVFMHGVARGEPGSGGQTQSDRRRHGEAHLQADC